MRISPKSPFGLIASVAVLLLSRPVSAAQPDFSGTWHQDLSRSVPVGNSRNAKELDIQQTGPELTVNTRTTTGQGERSLNLKYEVGGPELVYKGLDGDEFHTKVRWNGESLVFDTVEHERGREIVSQQIWTLAENGKILREVKHSQRAGQPTESLAVFEREMQR
jgi:hypothetical protein